MRSALPGRPTKPAVLRDRLTLKRNAVPPQNIVERAPRQPVVKAVATSLESILAVGGVVASFPPDIRKDAKHLQLDPTTASGTAAFWMRGIHCTAFPLSFAYSETCELHATVGDTSGVAGSVDWLPTEVAYGVEADADAYELASAAGYAVVTGVSFDGLLLSSEAAACGAGPPIFAAFCPECDTNDEAFLSATSGVSAPAAPANAANSVYLVTAAPSFLLADILAERDAAECSGIRKVLVPDMEATIHQATLSIARHLRSLADRHILVLDANSASIGFYPKLAVAEDGESLEAQGYGYEHRDGIVTKGVPKLTHLGGYAAKFRPGVSGFNSDAAYATAILSLLSSTRAVHGRRAMELLKFAVEGRTPSGAAIPEPELPEAFTSISLPAAMERAKGHAAMFASCVVGMGDPPISPHTAEELASVLGGICKEETAVLADVVRKTTNIKSPDCCIFASQCDEEDADVQRVRTSLAKARV